MQQPPALPTDTLASAVPSLALRLTADGFVYLYGLSEEESVAGAQEGYHTLRERSACSTQPLTMWSYRVA